MDLDVVARFRRIARIRVIQAALAFAALMFAELLTGRGISADWWFWVGLGTLVSSALVEPHFTDARASIGNGVAALGAAFGASWIGVAAAWRVYVVIAVVVIVSSIGTLLLNPGPLHAVARWLSSRLGKARLLGFTALLIEVVRVSGINTSDAVALLLGLGTAISLSSLDWYRLLAAMPGSALATAKVELATEPNLLLVGTDQLLPLGSRVRITAEGTAEGAVVAQMAHRTGSRFQVVLDKPWRSVVRHGNAECVIELLPDAGSSLGFAAEGSTERSIEVHPAEPLTYGQPILVRDSDEHTVIYQITALRLERNAWDNSSVIEPRAKALQVGTVSPNGLIRFRPYLPSPYQPLLRAGSMAVGLSAPFMRIGVVAGTGVEVGLDVGAARQGHMAILGMSGMGKTAVAHRLCQLLQDESAVVALDGTGEYSTRLGFPPFVDSEELATIGMYVYEPGGDPPTKCRDFIKKLMAAAHREYVGEDSTVNRTLLIEEAHSFLPEWNFATRSQGDMVSESCRYILQARKYGISFVFVSQRTAVISKSALSQCESYVIFRTLDHTSLEYIEAVVGAEYREAVSSLNRYQAICVGPAFNCSSPVIVDIDSPLQPDSTGER